MPRVLYVAKMIGGKSTVWRLRVDNDLSQDNFGKQVGLTRNAVSNIERGRPANRESFVKICKAFNCVFGTIACLSTDAADPQIVEVEVVESNNPDDADIPQRNTLMSLIASDAVLSEALALFVTWRECVASLAKVELVDHVNKHPTRVLAFCEEICKPFLPPKQSTVTSSEQIIVPRDTCVLTATEAFVLVAAIHVHDLGYYVGHERTFLDTIPSSLAVRGSHPQSLCKAMEAFSAEPLPDAMVAALERIYKTKPTIGAQVFGTVIKLAPSIVRLVEFHNSTNRAKEIETLITGSTWDIDNKTSVRSPIHKMLIAVLQIADALDMNAQRIVSRETLEQLAVKAERDELYEDDDELLFRALRCHYVTQTSVKYEAERRTLVINVQQHFSKRMMNEDNLLMADIRSSLQRRLDPQANDCLGFIQDYGDVKVAAPTFRSDISKHPITVSCDLAERLVSKWARHEYATQEVCPRIRAIFDEVFKNFHVHLFW
ncbi:MAG: helix-turn-helix transcriptional regulator, partial [Planctomycetota bacterium]